MHAYLEDVGSCLMDIVSGSNTSSSEYKRGSNLICLQATPASDLTITAPFLLAAAKGLVDNFAFFMGRGDVTNSMSESLRVYKLNNIDES